MCKNRIHIYYLKLTSMQHGYKQVLVWIVDYKSLQELNFTQGAHHVPLLFSPISLDEWEGGGSPCRSFALGVKVLSPSLPPPVCIFNGKLFHRHGPTHKQVLCAHMVLLDSLQETVVILCAQLKCIFDWNFRYVTVCSSVAVPPKQLEAHSMQKNPDRLKKFWFIECALTAFVVLCAVPSGWLSH